jgi:hypothetical protein
VTQSVNINVLKAPLTITADDKTKTYGQVLPSLTASYSGFVNGDTVSSLSTQPNLSTTATDNSPVGNYTISVGAAASSNYTINFINGTLTVNPALLTITVNSQSKVYGAPVPNLTATFYGFVNGDTVSSLDTQPTLATVASIGSPVGTYPVTVSGASGTNYTMNFVGGTLTVTPAALTITADNQFAFLGAPLPVLTASYFGFVNGDIAASLTVPPTLTTIATNGSPAGTYPIIVDGAVSTNYAITFVNGALTVFPPNSASIQANGQGGFQLNFTGLPGQTWTIQYTTNLANPWLTLGRATVDVSGNFTFNIEQGLPFGFYRLSYP